MSVKADIFTSETQQKGMHNPVVALNYSGRYDITEASREIARKVKHGILQVEDIRGNPVRTASSNKWVEFPNPDLLIRTSGELRLSNFMLWQSAYTELFSSTNCFLILTEEDLVEGTNSMSVFSPNILRVEIYPQNF